MEWFLSWLEGFIIFRILTAAILSLVPDPSYEPYIKFAAGLILILLLLHPVYEITGQAGELERILMSIGKGGF